MLGQRLKSGSEACNLYEQPVLPYATLPYLPQLKAYIKDKSLTENNPSMNTGSCKQISNNNTKNQLESIIMIRRPHKS